MNGYILHHHQHPIILIKNRFNDFVPLLEQLKDQLFILENESYKMARGVLTLFQNHEPMDKNKFIVKNLQNPLMVQTKKSPPPSSPTLVNQPNNCGERLLGGCNFQPSMVEDEQMFVHEFECFDII